MPRTLPLTFDGSTIGTADDPARPHTYKLRTWNASRCQQAILDLPAAVGTSLASAIVAAATGALTSPAARRIVDLLSQPAPQTEEEKLKRRAHGVADVLELLQLGLERLSSGIEIDKFIESVVGTDVLTLFVRLARGSLVRLEPQADGSTLEIDVVPDVKAAYEAQEATDFGVDNFYAGERFAELLPLTMEMLRRNLGPLGRRSLWSAVLKLGSLANPSTTASSGSV